MHEAKQRIFVAGHKGMVGSAIVRKLQGNDKVELIVRSRAELDLTCQAAVNSFFAKEQIDEVYLAAARVGGIYANNSYPAEFIYENLIIECNVIHAAYRYNIEQLLLLAASCIYPKLASQPITEQALLTGQLESTNEPYAIAKIAGIKLCESYNRQYNSDYRSVMPTNLYGINDNFHPKNSHVVPALMCRFYKAKLNNDNTVTVWGSGAVRREFLYVDDMAAACIYIMGLDKKTYQQHTKPMLSHINIGTGVDNTIAQLAAIIANIVGFAGKIVFDNNYPDGTPRKLMDVTRLTNLGWHHQTDLEQGLQKTYKWLVDNKNILRA